MEFWSFKVGILGKIVWQGHRNESGKGLAGISIRVPETMSDDLSSDEGIWKATWIVVDCAYKGV